MAFKKQDIDSNIIFISYTYKFDLQYSKSHYLVSHETIASTKWMNVEIECMIANWRGNAKKWPTFIVFIGMLHSNTENLSMEKLKRLMQWLKRIIECILPFVHMVFVCQIVFYQNKFPIYLYIWICLIFILFSFLRSFCIIQSNHSIDNHN